jgi:hypothetical protein
MGPEKDRGKLKDGPKKMLTGEQLSVKNKGKESIEFSTPS